jgi:hypothetical protein
MRAGRWIVFAGACACAQEGRDRDTPSLQNAVGEVPSPIPYSPPEFSPLESLSADLLGYWIVDDYTGDCLDVVNYLRVSAGG